MFLTIFAKIIVFYYYYKFWLKLSIFVWEKIQMILINKFSHFLYSYFSFNLKR